MEKIFKYKANDGAEFNFKDDCLKYEAEAKEIQLIMSELPEKPDNCRFGNGGGYIQHDKKTFMSVRTKLLEIAKRHTDHKWIQESIDKGLDAHPSYAGRIISDLQKAKSLKYAWYRIMATDDKLREWGQPYYADHPEHAKQKQLN